MWVDYYEPETKCLNMDWKHPANRKKIKIDPLAGKVMLTLLLNEKGPTVDIYMDRGIIINNASYSDLLATS